MNKQSTKKINSRQKTIAVLAIIVTVLLAICVTFAWYTNKINVMNGLFETGEFNYTVTLYNVNTDNRTVAQAQTATYDRQSSDKWSLSSTTLGLGSDSVMYQLVKVNNNSGFGIKAYEYLTYNEMSAQETALANYFYFKPYKLNISGDATVSQINTFLSTYTFPTATDISSPSSDITFGTIKDNAVALEKNAIEDDDTSYYLLAYCVTGLPDELIFPSGLTVDVNPVLAIGQANGPVPQTTSSGRTIFADSWQALRNAIASANSGDTIYLTRVVESPVGTNLSLTNGVNINLNGYNLTIHGDLVFNYKTTDARKLTVPSSSRLTVDGNIYVETIGSFSINSTGSSRNVFIGTRTDETSGNLYVNARLSVEEGDPTDLSTTSINEDAGFTLNNIQILKVDENGNNVPADLTVTGSDTMVKVTSGAVLNSITTPYGRNINDVYIVNYGVINSIDLSNIDYAGKSLKVGAYVKNNNSVTSLSLKSGSTGAKGFRTDSVNYNTRVVNGDGSMTAFSGNYNSPYFMAADIEPFSAGSTDSLVVENDALNGVYTVYLRNVNANSGNNYELITALFTQYGFNANACKSLKLITNNGIAAKQGQLENIRDNFVVLEKLNLSNAAMANSTITNNAFSATVTGSKMQHLKEVTLPITSVSIGSGAFQGTQLEEVTISSNVTSIGANAFDVASDNIEVIWDNSIDIPATFLNGFNVNRTTIFMEESLAQRAMTSSYTDAWKLNMYEFYDFKAQNGIYYCKYARDGSTATGCEIIYYAGTIAEKEEDDLVPAELNDGSTNYTVIGVNRQAFRKAIINDAGATTAGVHVDLSNCISVGDKAFEGVSNETRFVIKPLTLGTVRKIGASAFKNCLIEGSVARPNAFGGMVSLGAYAFQNSSVTGGILDLHGPTEKYTPEDYALADFTINGAYGSGNAVLDLHNVNTLYSNFASGAHIEADLLLNNTNTIAAGAFSGAIIQNDNTTPTNIVDARDVRSIGQNSFFNIQCGTLYLGTNDDDIYDAMTAYEGIIGATSGRNIGTLVLDGTFATSTTPALASGTASQVVRIGTLKIARVTDGNDVVKTMIPQYAFATNGTVSSGTFSGLNLVIGGVDTSDTSGGNTVYASFDIGADAFRGTNFTTNRQSDEYDFEGVIEVGAEAFAYSNISNLNLGESISVIHGEDFIKHCDAIRSLTFETILPSQADDYSDYMVTLEGSDAANPAFSSSNTEVGTQNDPFRIHVPQDVLPTYIADSVWTGWKNYFAPLVRTYVDSGGVWYYNIISSDPSEQATMGIQIIGYKRTGADPMTSRTIVTVPYRINGIYVREFGGDEDILKETPDSITGVAFYFDSNSAPYIEYFSPAALSSPRLVGIRLGNATNTRFFVAPSQSHTLYRKLNKGSTADLEIVKVFNYTWSTTTGPTGQTIYTYSILSPNTAFTIPQAVSKIQNNAFEDNKRIVSVKVQNPTSASFSNLHLGPKLNYIGADAFKGSTVQTFDFRNCFDTEYVVDSSQASGYAVKNHFASKVVTLGKDALKSPRKEVINAQGYHEYVRADAISIIVPDGIVANVVSGSNVMLSQMYLDDSSYFLYGKYGCITAATPDSRYLPSAADEAAAKKGAKEALNSGALDVTLSGVKYHVLLSGTEYDGTVYGDEETNAMVAVVTGFTGKTETAEKIVIPSSISVKGKNYDVVAITDKAFGDNDVLETLVLPNREIAYSSAALAGCTKLGTIQFNDILAYAENAENTVASLPVETTQALIEDHSEDTTE